MLQRPLLIQITLIVCTLTVGMLGIDMILPSIESMAQSFHASQQSMQQTVAVFLAGMGLSLLISGPCSDFMGRKPVVIYGLIWSILINLLMPWVQNVQVFLLLRFLQGIGAGAASGLCRVMIADRFQGKDLAMYGSIVTLVSTLTLMWAPTLGGYIQTCYHWSINFYLLALLQFMVCLLVYSFGTESNKNCCRSQGIRSIAHQYQTFFASQTKAFFLYCVISGLMFSLPMIFATLSPYIFLNQLKLTPVVYGWVMFFVGFGSIVGRFLVPFVLKKFQMDRIILMAMTTMILLTLLLLDVTITWPDAMFIMVGIVTFTRICQPFIGPSVMSKALSPFSNNRGLAGSFYGCIQQLLAFVVCAIVGLFDSGSPLLAISYCIVVVATFLLFKKTQAITSSE